MINKNKFYVIGAHSRAQTLEAYLSHLYPEASIEAYLVNDKEKNADRIRGVPVIRIDEETRLNCDYPVFIGTRSVHHKKLTQAAKELGMRKIYPVTVELDRKLRNAYLQKYFSEINREFPKIDREETLGEMSGSVSPEMQACVYVAQSVYDQKLKTELAFADYEKTIQVGAALTERRLKEGGIIDSVGENISLKNKQYCELTGLYWIWKHAREEILGLVHYRRHFLLPEDWVRRMQAYDIDAILPVPLYLAPNVEENYKERHIPKDWDYMMEYFKKMRPREYECAMEVFHGNLLVPCNMFIVRRSVLKDLCNWMFPIVDAVAAHCGEHNNLYQNRYLGFLSERLITLFFEMHRNRYKIVYADKNFLQ